MKQLIFLEIIRELKVKTKLRRKVKLFVVVGIIGFLVAGALTVGAAVSVFSYLGSQAKEVIQSPQASAQAELLKSEIAQISGKQALNCWSQVLNLMSIEPWLARPALANLQSLQHACLNETPPVCPGPQCPESKKIINSTEGRTI